MPGKAVYMAKSISTRRKTKNSTSNANLFFGVLIEMDENFEDIFQSLLIHVEIKCVYKLILNVINVTRIATARSRRRQCTPASVGCPENFPRAGLEK